MGGGVRGRRASGMTRPTAAAATAVPFPPKKYTGLQLLLHVIQISHLLSFQFWPFLAFGGKMASKCKSYRM